MNTHFIVALGKEIEIRKTHFQASPFYIRGIEDALRLAEKYKSKDDVFIRHIQSHLDSDMKVVCKICGKSAADIIKGESDNG